MARPRPAAPAASRSRRLVETPAEIERRSTSTSTRAASSTRTPALTTGYDFLTDGGEATFDRWLALVGRCQRARCINDTWTSGDLDPDVHGQDARPADVLSVNAHYNHWELEPAAGASARPADDRGDPDAGEPAFAADPVHDGLPRRAKRRRTRSSGRPRRPPARPARLGRRARRSRSAAVYVANTGFGYGDTVRECALRAADVDLRAKIASGGPIGEQWIDALREYFAAAGSYAVYDEKALTEATLLRAAVLADRRPARRPRSRRCRNDPVNGIRCLVTARLCSRARTIPGRQVLGRGRDHQRRRSTSGRSSRGRVRRHVVPARSRPA